ncbi:MAG: hypothetical protein AAF289_00870 [Cyanobacteria bacterium P01_A01_bin.135]
MTRSMWWQYLNQRLWDKRCPAVLNPLKYRRLYRVRQLKCCLHNAFLERCWTASYQKFIFQYSHLCERQALEEDPVWFLKRCWSLKRRRSQHRESASWD